MTSTEQRIAALLSEAWGHRVKVLSTSPVWERPHVLHVRTADGRTAIAKRPRRGDEHLRFSLSAFEAERTGLAFLGRMPDPVAPRLLAADSDLLVMEELPMGRSLADSLLGTDEALATADLIAFAEALARVHVWSSGRDDLPAAAAQPWWAAAVERGRGPFLELFARFGIAAPEVDAVIDDVLDEVRGGGYPSFVHGDPCPDNVRIVDGRARIFDFEMSSIGSMALDATYLLAPFPSCWCFASLPAAVSGAARLAYEQMVSTAGVNLAARWQRAVTAALAAAVVAHGTVITTALDDDKRWGTTTMRPRLLQWMSALAQAAGTEFAPLVSAVTELQHHLRALWPDIDVPEYPAFARVGRTRVEAPEWWGSQS